jgi:hypothetical protein
MNLRFVQVLYRNLSILFLLSYSLERLSIYFKIYKVKTKQRDRHIILFTITVAFVVDRLHQFVTKRKYYTRSCKNILYSWVDDKNLQLLKHSENSALFNDLIQQNNCIYIKLYRPGLSNRQIRQMPRAYEG